MAGDVVKQMEIHGRGLKKPANRGLIADRCKGYRATLRSLRSEYEAAVAQHEKELLICTGAPSHTDAELDLEYGMLEGEGDDQKERLISAEDKLHRSASNIKRSLEVLAETEAVGRDISAELSRSRETIESASARVKAADEITSQARRVIRSMSQREVQQRLVMVCLVVMLLVGGGLAAWSSSWR
eukprot:CAMPEP_0172630218 /NCGR_PEP_ID=MMETSP1068-20121228/172581_1 /TAXON_ID=35684 /ORGANISM="Pseudopedinella elastica, Strain CCMP716" /LENGTH=184 /DNA_ID=CAMNT_0013441009 /DNA_START=45 /DNA_END=599 /DNA_ORIENTATION=+